MLQIFLLMLLASYLTGFIISFFIGYFASKISKEGNRHIEGLKAGLLSWVWIAALFVSMCESIDESKS